MMVAQVGLSRLSVYLEVVLDVMVHPAELMFVESPFDAELEGVEVKVGIKLPIRDLKELQDVEPFLEFGFDHAQSLDVHEGPLVFLDGEADLVVGFIFLSFELYLVASDALAEEVDQVFILNLALLEDQALLDIKEEGLDHLFELDARDWLELDAAKQIGIDPLPRLDLAILLGLLVHQDAVHHLDHFDRSSLSRLNALHSGRPELGLLVTVRLADRLERLEACLRL